MSRDLEVSVHDCNAVVEECRNVSLALWPHHHAQVGQHRAAPVGNGAVILHTKFPLQLPARRRQLSAQAANVRM